ncbi:MAG: hypothetical protein RBJ76_13255 [Stenomitos frigidus ULC029]
MIHTPTQQRLLDFIPEVTDWQHLAFLPDVICEALLEMTIANLGSGLPAIQANVKLKQLATMPHHQIIDLWNTQHPGAEIDNLNQFVSVSPTSQALLTEQAGTGKWLRYAVFAADKVLVLREWAGCASYATHIYYPLLNAYEYGHYTATQSFYDVMASFEHRLQEHLT